MSNLTLLFMIFALPSWADWQSRYRTGERLLGEGKTQEAISVFEQALAEAGDKDKGAVFEALGRAESRAGRYRNAKRHFEASLPLWPLDSRERAMVLYNLGQVNLYLQYYARAEELLTLALQTLSGEPAVWHSLGQAQFRLRRPDEAETSFRKALSLADRTMRPSIASDLATILEANRQYAKAAEIWREAIAQASPGQARARMQANLAALQWNWNEKDQAAGLYRSALAEMEAAVGPRHPDVATILESYQEVLRKSGRKAEAMAANERASAIRSSFAPQTNDHGFLVDWRDLRR